jgi:hypothetical protein
VRSIRTEAGPVNERREGAAAAPPPPHNPDKADLTAWLAVIAGAIGALMATLDISIVNSALPTIQGEIGASSTGERGSRRPIWSPKSSSSPDRLA